MKKPSIVLLALLAAATLASAQETLTLEQAVKTALANNESLSRSRIDLKAAERAVDVSWSGIVPGLSLGAGSSKPNDGESAAYGLAKASLTLSSGLLSAGKKARLAYETRLLAYETAERDLELSVRKAYYSLGLSRKNIGLIEQNIASAQKSYDQAEVKRKAGLAPELDALSALVTLEKLKPSLESAKLSYDKSLDSFRVLLGLGGDTSVDIVAVLEAEIKTVDITGIVASTPTVAALEKQLADARMALSDARRSIYSPSLSLSASYQPTYAMESWSDSGSLTASLSFSLDSLMPWSNARSTASTAEDTVTKLESQLAAAKDSASMEIRSLVKQIAQSRSALESKQLNETLAEKTYRLTEEAYRFGTKDILRLQSAQDSLAQARLDVSQEAYTLQAAILDLEYILGVPFGTLGR